MMAYQNSYVFSVISTKTNRPLREFSENGERTCIVPFDSEYKIRLKNKTWKRCKVKVFIDEMDTSSDGGSFVLGAQQTLDLERFVDDLRSGKKFKFVSLEKGTKSGEITDPTSPDNGLIRVEFHPERDYHFTTGYYNTGCWCTKINCLCDGGRKTYYVTSSGGTCSIPLINSGSTLTVGTGSNQFIGSVNTSYVNNCATSSTSSVTFDTYATNVSTGASSCNAGSTLTSSSLNVSAETKGATVQGNDSNQSFQYVSDFQTESPTVISLRMRGPSSEIKQENLIDNFSENLSDAMKEVNLQLEKARELQKQVDELKKQIPQSEEKGYLVIFKGSLIIVKLDGREIATSKNSRISLSDEVLKIKRDGSEIESRLYKVITA